MAQVGWVKLVLDLSQALLEVGLVVGIAAKHLHELLGLLVLVDQLHTHEARIGLELMGGNRLSGHNGNRLARLDNVLGDDAPAQQDHDDADHDGSDDDDVAVLVLFALEARQMLFCYKFLGSFRHSLTSVW